MIVKNKSLVTSEIVWELVKREIYGYEKIDGILDTFNNCRETGLMFSSFNGTLHIWVFAHRNTDEITVVYGDINDSNNMFNEEEYDNKVRFGYDYEEAAYFVSNLLKKNVEENEMENLEEYLESIKSYDERLSRACDCLNDLTYDIDDFVNEAESEQKEIEEKISDISDDEDSEEIKQLEIREDKLDELLNNIYDLQRSAKKACDCLGDLNYDFDNWNESVE